jgi:hypothetical protein
LFIIDALQLLLRFKLNLHFIISKYLQCALGNEDAKKHAKMIKRFTLARVSEIEIIGTNDSSPPLRDDKKFPFNYKQICVLTALHLPPL